MNTYVTGAAIRDLREKRGITQNELAEQIGVSNKTVSKWETARGLPDISLLQPLAAALGVSVIELMNGEPIVNRFQSGDLAYYGGENMKYVSRSDWKGTFPSVKLELELTESLMAKMTGIKQYEKVVVEGEEMPTLGSTATHHKLFDMVSLDYDDPKWEELLDQITYEELCNLIGVGYHGTIHLDSVSKPETLDENGPQGFSANLTDLTGNAMTLCAYTDENIMAATWNVELMEELGEHIGEDGLWAGYSGLYGPAMNTHAPPTSAVTSSIIPRMASWAARSPLRKSRASSARACMCS